MKIRILIGLLILIILVSGCTPKAIVRSEVEKESTKDNIEIDSIKSKINITEYDLSIIDKEVLESFNKQSRVDITIILKQETDYDEIMNLLNNEFELKNKHITGISFSGYITKEGLDKIKDNPKIARIYLHRTLQLHTL